jgi:hypothetical protein
MPTLRFALHALIAVALIGSAGCSSSSATPTPSPISRPNLYVTACSGTHMVDVFTPPFSSSSTPSIMVPFPSGPMCAISGAFLPKTNQVAVGTNGGGWYIYQLPLTNTSAPTAHITTPGFAGGFVQDGAGNLFVSDRTLSAISIFSPPFSNSSTPSVTFTAGLGGPYALQLNAAGQLFAGNCDNQAVTIYTPPFTNSSAPTTTISVGCARAIGLDAAGNLYAGDFANNSITQFQPPYSNSSAFVIFIIGEAATNTPAGFAFDNVGNLYTSHFGANTVTGVPTPLTLASPPPMVTIQTEQQPAGIFFGP